MVADASAGRAPGRPDGGSRLRRWFAGPPGWVLAAAGTVGLLVTAWAYSVPGVYFDFALGSWLIWVCVGAAYLLKAAVLYPLFGEWHGSPWRLAARWLTVPVLVFAASSFLATDLAVRAGIMWAEPSVTAYAEDPGAQAPERFGPYRVLRAEHLDGGGARFLVEDAGFLDTAGFAYSPGGRPPHPGEDTYRHVSGPWYTWIHRL
ncbi:hypothetical protein FZ103_05930 [Streptomonospora sp. PA3]|uniref:hypothetical protein n=1 Tax=Streptomonospora sp. PA3 TaxID=2607326 RepID=UPI0012DED61B|nr:hypothetical protein [Streptomonospora sp. PA3]MUL40724.1 hypothetical protein [Streptomonospora sp. PA3]